ncbi:MAG TPA: hypothetical protein PKE40_15740 [Arachnia sp.]|nr:hypothetical protein [Arachnia sp.]HMT87793.1 hypothetical protein [Arachnia sp.]
MLLPVLVIVAAHSRFVTARMIPTRKTEDLLLGFIGAGPAARTRSSAVIWDNGPGIGQKGRLAHDVAAFAGTLATKSVQLKPFDPESRGSSSAATAGSKPRSCPEARSAHQWTSTPGRHRRRTAACLRFTDSIGGYSR